VFDLGDFRSDDSFKPVKYGTCPEAFQWGRPGRTFAEAHGIVVAVCVPEPQHQSSRRLQSQRINELLFEEPHGGGAQNDDALLMEPDNPLIGTEVEQRGEVEVLKIRRLGVCRSFHISLWVHSMTPGKESKRHQVLPSAWHSSDKNASL